MRIDYSRQFLRQLAKSPIEVKRAFRSRFDLFISNQYHPLLRNHKLKGAYAALQSINITGDWRALYREIDDLSEFGVYFVTMGTHSMLYK